MHGGFDSDGEIRENFGKFKKAPRPAIILWPTYNVNKNNQQFAISKSI